MRILIALLLCPLAWGAAFTSKSTGNWSSAGQTTWNEVGVPGNGDTVSIANTHTVTVTANVTVGASGAPVYSYISSLAVGAAGTGGSGACTVTFGGSPTVIGGTGQAATCTLSSGGVSTVAFTYPRKWYAGASTAPTCAFSATGLSGSACSVVWQQGGGTAAIKLNASGKLVVASGAILRVRGDILYTAAAGNTANGVEMQARSSLVFDSSLATALSDGSKPIYSYGGDANAQFRGFALSGTSESPVNLSSDAAGAVATISLHGYSTGGVYVWNYANVSRLGDTGFPVLEAQYLATLPATIDIQHSQFDSCSRVWKSADAANATTRYNFNRTTNTVGTTPLFFVSSTSTGTREIKNNVFDKQPGNGGVSSGSQVAFVLDNNIFMDGVAMNGLTASSVGNAVLGTTATTLSSGSALGNLHGDGVTCAMAHDNFYAFIGPKNNPHLLGTQANSLSLDICKVMFWPSEDIPSAGYDTGEAFAGSLGTNAVAYFSHWLLLPNRRGFASAKLGNAAMTNGATLSWDHTTSWSGYDIGLSTVPSFAVGYNENATAPSGQLASFRANLMVSYTDTGTLPFTKVSRVNENRVTLNICPSGTCDYNAIYGAGNHYLATTSWCATDCGGQANGYIGKFDYTPGAHDIDVVNGGMVDPKLVDYKRTPEFWDSGFLGHSYGEWNAGTAYTLGQQVSHAISGWSWGTPVNYRCKVSTCTAGLEPGNTTANASWYDQWEFSTVYQLREAVLAGTTYTDAALQIPGSTLCTVGAPCGPVVAMMQWIRQGYRPQNPALAVSYVGDTEQYIGAVPVKVTAATSGGDALMFSIP